MNPDVFFLDLVGPLRIVVVSVIAYVALILILRISGKRVLSKLNAYDLIVTIALGSILATIILDRTLPLLDGLVALAVLVLLQWTVSWTTARFPFVRSFVTADPTLLLSDGHLRVDNMKRERMGESEVLQAIRDKGGRELGDADVVILQCDGSMAVILFAKP